MTLTATTLPVDDPAIAALRGVGAKVTSARVRVLQQLRAAPGPLTHRELLDAVQMSGGMPVDRVTVYRVLDWLVEQQLAQKAADQHGVFRFAAAQGAGTHDTHVHFRCATCGGVFCLKDAPPPRPRLPKGFRLTRMDVDIQGECARCARAH
jgi:Fur family ferric uptake transcriptional regulator